LAEHTGEGIIRTLAAVPSESMFVKVDIINGAEIEDDIFRVYVNYKDKDNNHHADFVIGDAADQITKPYLMRLYKNDNLLLEEEILNVTEPPSGFNRLFTVCIGGMRDPDNPDEFLDYQFTAGVSNSIMGFAWTESTPIHEGYRAGLGFGHET
jgi:hypothetical protein